MIFRRSSKVIPSSEVASAPVEAQPALTHQIAPVVYSPYQTTAECCTPPAVSSHFDTTSKGGQVTVEGQIFWMPQRQKCGLLEIRDRDRYNHTLKYPYPIQQDSERTSSFKILDKFNSQHKALITEMGEFCQPNFLKISTVEEDFQAKFWIQIGLKSLNEVCQEFNHKNVFFQKAERGMSQLGYFAIFLTERW